MSFCIADLTVKNNTTFSSESKKDITEAEVPNNDTRWGLIAENDMKHIELKLKLDWITEQFAGITSEKKIITSTFHVLMRIIEARADVFQNPGQYGIYRRLKQYDSNPANNAAIPLLKHTIACLEANSLFIKKQVIISLRRIIYEMIYFLTNCYPCQRWQDESYEFGDWHDVERYQNYWDRDEALVWSKINKYHIFLGLNM